MYTLLFLLQIAMANAKTFAPLTTFKPGGNEEVVARYQHYLANQHTCVPLNDGPRVILTGFGIWDNAEISYSGYLIDNLASNDFWPEGGNSPQPVKGFVPKTGVLKNEGARIVNRTFTIANGRSISACLILVDVLWDFAGAVVATEMEKFQPNAVIMMGVGSTATVEGGAINSAYPLPGYIDGIANKINYPQSDAILPQFRVGSTIPMTWDVDKIARAVIPFEPEVRIRREADPGNDYVCNNLSYIALQAAAGADLTLADGMLKLKPIINSRPQVGFYHFENSLTGDISRLKKYSQMVLAMVAAAL